jgi:hypothetical protein
MTSLPSSAERAAQLHEHWRRHADPGRYPTSQAADQAAVAAVRGRAAGQALDGIADAWGLSTGRVSDASVTIKHGPDLIGAVGDGRQSLANSAVVGRLRRDHPDLAAKAEAAFARPRPRSTYALQGLAAVAWQRDLKTRQRRREARQLAQTGA